MVTSHKMSENKMGYRGTKSVFFEKNTVKAQRVDGNWCGVTPHLRCILMGSESCYQIKNPSKQLNKQK